MIGLNTGRKPKNLWTEQGEGPKIKVFRGDTEHDEGYFVTSEISKSVTAGKAIRIMRSCTGPMRSPG